MRTALTKARRSIWRLFEMRKTGAGPGVRSHPTTPCSAPTKSARYTLGSIDRGCLSSCGIRSREPYRRLTTNRGCARRMSPRPSGSSGSSNPTRFARWRNYPRKTLCRAGPPGPGPRRHLLLRGLRGGHGSLLPGALHLPGGLLRSGAGPRHYPSREPKSALAPAVVEKAAELYGGMAADVARLVGRTPAAWGATSARR